jgi:hypothetical protein
MSIILVAIGVLYLVASATIMSSNKYLGIAFVFFGLATFALAMMGEK